MPGDRPDAWARLLEEGDALTRAAGSAARATAAPGSDDTESVRAILDGDGRVAAITVATGWRRRLGQEGLPYAVLADVRDAAVRRLEAWGTVYSEDDRDRSVGGSGSGTNDVVASTAETQRRLQEVAETVPAGGHLVLEATGKTMQLAVDGVLQQIDALDAEIDKLTVIIDQLIVALPAAGTPLSWCMLDPLQKA